MDHSARIAEIRTILRSGAREVTTDGTTVKYDLAGLRQELADLMAADDTERGKRPRAARIRLGGF
jgi:hypothetical protein